MAQNAADTAMWKLYGARGFIPIVPSLQHHDIHNPPIRTEAGRRLFSIRSKTRQDVANRVPESEPEPRALGIDLHPFPAENLSELERPPGPPSTSHDLKPINEEYIWVDENDDSGPEKLQRAHTSFRQKSRNAASKLLSRSRPLSLSKLRGRSVLAPGVPDATTSAQMATGPGI